MHVPFVTFLYKEKNTKNVFLSWRKRRKNSQKRKSPANNHGISGISKFSRKLYIFPIFNTTQLQLSIHIAHISTKWNFFVESFRVRWKRGGGGGRKKKENGDRVQRVSWLCSHPRLTLNAYEESRGRVVDTSPLVISRSVDRESIDRWTNAVLSHSRGPALRQQPTPSP